MADSFWMDDARTMVESDLIVAKDAMRKAIGRPVKRRPNTKMLVAEAMASPESVLADPSGRSTLAGYLRDTYGESSRHLLPYLGLEEDV